VLVIGEQPVSGFPLAGWLATTAARVEHLEPVFGIDVNEKTIPQETGLVDRAVSFTKGCYLGQELVARIDTRGRVNRHLRRIAITRNVVPPEGASILHDGTEVGSLTSVTENLTSPIGMSLVRREVEPGNEVVVRWGDGEQEWVPGIVQGGTDVAST
jgi:folate-binding protein YgfZ